MQAGVLGMMIVPLKAARAESQAAAEETDFKIEAWSSSEAGSVLEEELDEDADGGEVFQYRRFRYTENLGAVEQPAPKRRFRPRPGKGDPARRKRRGDSDEEGEEGEGCNEPWCAGEAVEGPLPRFAWPATRRPASPRRLVEADAADAALLKRVATALARFYGLPGDAAVAVKLRPPALNSVVVDDEAWKKKTRPSELEDPPAVWVRGNRVYDFHGDRGTVDEFEHDLLERRVEDDFAMRNRRREQNLAPFPHLPLPLRRPLDDDDYDDAEPSPVRPGRGAGGGPAAGRAAPRRS